MEELKTGGHLVTLLFFMSFIHSTSGDCLYGMYGEHCQYVCSRYCPNRLCSSADGSCLSSGCTHIGLSGKTCQKYCDADGCRCMQGWYGKDCRYQCLNCKNNTCHPSTGECFFGCNQGWRRVANCHDKCVKIGTECKLCKTMFYGRNCRKPCNKRCAGKCDQNTGYCTQCKENRFGNFCKNRCSKNCEGPCHKQTGNCQQCKEGTYGDKCEFVCNRNCKRNECHPDGSCRLGCISGWKGSLCKCPLKCGDCFANGQCRSCKVGSFGKKCTKTCPNRCLGPCNKKSGKCFKCVPGRFGAKCDRVCSSSCGGDGSCDQTSGSCTECEMGMYGKNCDLQCANTNCHGNSCNRDGSCKLQCKLNWYGSSCERRCNINCPVSTGCDRNTGQCKSCEPNRFGPLCDRQCSFQCRNGCNGTSGTCNGCEDGWFGDNCQYRCSAHCSPGTSCSQNTGTCQGCLSGWYGLKCDEKCHLNCVEGCKQQSGECNKCRAGWWGGQCNTRCHLSCANQTGCQQTTGKCFGCDSGFYGDFCNNVCPAPCKNCNQETGRCKSCSPGSFGEDCKLCSQNCLYKSQCDAHTGSCVGGCKSGFYGSLCDLRCSPNCRNGSCNDVSGRCILGCEPGWKGSTCQSKCDEKHFGMNCANKCYNCVQPIIGDSTPFCNPVTGNCTKGCIDGFFGDTCQARCSVNCMYNYKCNKITGECNNGCKAGWHGDRCDKLCNSTTFGHQCNETCGKCLNNVQCDRIDGTCGSGCEPGYTGSRCRKVCESGFYGFNCSSFCDNCQNNSCNSVSGLCLLGCQGNFEMPSCLSRKESLVASTSKSEVVWGTIVAVVVLFILLVITIIIFIKKRKSRKPYAEERYEISAQGSSNAADNMAYANVGSISMPSHNGYLEDHSGRMDSHNRYLPFIESLKPEEEIEENIYYNDSDVAMGIPVNELKTYVNIKKHDNSLLREFKKIEYGSTQPHIVGEEAENRPKNRFKTTFPYDHSRVILGLGMQTEADYINANYIDGTKEEEQYIATQGPLKTTIKDFWQMVWENKVGKIVMLTNLIEGTKTKCEQYWPNMDKPGTLGNFTITLLDQREFSYFIHREFMLQNKEEHETRHVFHIHYISWPDHGVPDALSLVLFQRRVEQTKTRLNGPTLVHCSAGIGRTGTYIALDALLEQGRSTGRVAIPEYVKRMRKNRMNMIQTAEQYIVLHDTLVESFQTPETSIQMNAFQEEYQKMTTDKSPISKQRLWKEYQQLSSMKKSYESVDYLSSLSAENIKKNRMSTTLALEKYRPYLISYVAGRTDYINAVILPSHTRKVGFLVTQKPLLTTVTDFWRLIVDHDSTLIVHFEKEEKDKILFYPANTGNLVTEVCTVTRTSEEKLTGNITKFEMDAHITNSEETISVMLFCVSMGNSSLPSPSQVISLLQMIDDVQSEYKAGPITVVSSNGANPCDIFCASSINIESLKIDNCVDIFQTVRQLQIRRPEFFSKYVSIVILSLGIMIITWPDEAMVKGDQNEEYRSEILDCIVPEKEMYRLCYDVIDQYVLSDSIYFNS